jgi:hypothetical protein
MSDILSLKTAALVRTAKKIRSDVARIRMVKATHGKVKLPAEERQNLKAQLLALKDDLTGQVAAYGGLAASNAEVVRYLDVARNVIRDCEEMLALLP